jgi:hypothetical protein
MRLLRLVILLWSGLTCVAVHAQTWPLAGVIDIHAHTAPDSVSRSIDAIDLAKLAQSRGMRAIVFKNHYEPTASTAYLVQKIVPGIQSFGGIDLNLSVGGMNPIAVEKMALTAGGLGRFVWMGTYDTYAQVQAAKDTRGGRNQHFALYLATRLRGCDGPIAVLSAGSDGIDGNSEAAGAIVDQNTAGDDLRRDQALRALRNFDSSSWLEGAGATVVTGLTGHNLRDLRILLTASGTSRTKHS